MWTTMPSPAGELRIVATAGSLTAIDFLGPTTGTVSPRSSVAHAAGAAAGRPLGDRDDGDEVLRAAVAQLEAYFSGGLRHFDLPLGSSGTSFQTLVWAELCRVGYGETVSYGELARRLGKTAAASRAVGLANGRNPLPIVVPCHRVVGAGGALTGYAGGVARKRLLLDLERGALF
jgi:methylated-DNA-[protein]-cysteine S-methyltransferase